MAALVSPLVVSGSRLSTGEPNDTGVVYAYQPGTTSPAILYADADASTVITQPVILDNGGRVPYDTYPDGLWVTAPVRLLIQDISGNTVSDFTFWPSDARTDELVNDGFTGDTVDQALSALFASTGGQDGEYKESGGATSRPIQDKFREIWLSVKDFGAAGNGIAVDTTAIQTTINRAKSLIDTSTNLGGVVVWFPAGSYKIDQALTLSSAVGISLRGGSSGSTMIISTNSAANGITLTTCSFFNISGLRIRPPTGGSSGIGLSFIDCADVIATDVILDSNSGGLYLNAVKAGTSAGNSTVFIFEQCEFIGQDTALGRGLWLQSTTFSAIRDCFIGASSTGTDLELSGTTGNIIITGTFFFSAASGVLWATGMTGVYFTIAGNPTLGVNTFSTAAINLAGLTTDPYLRQWGNGVDGGTYSAAIGSTLTIKRGDGEDAKLVAASGGAGTQTVAAPTPTPQATARNVWLTTRFVNGAGGAVTWSLNAVFVANTTIPTTDAHTIIVRWLWDATKWREASRADTVT
jgi:hypothetical protein